MKAQALQVVKDISNPNDKLNRLREYLQTVILRSFHESGAFGCLAFVGGTALRFLYDLPRFSEDLDFSLHHATTPYQFEKWMGKLKRDLTFADLESSVMIKTEKTVHSAWVKTPQLLYEAGLTDQLEQKLAIKIEIDTKPPAGAHFENQVINRYFLFAVRHYDLPSLMAGKINAMISRAYPKGRDYYDLLWYLSKTPPLRPNLSLLEAGLKQTEKIPPTAKNWKLLLLKKFDQVDWQKIVGDVEKFLERPEELSLLTKKNLVSKITARLLSGPG